MKSRKKSGVHITRHCRNSGRSRTTPTKNHSHKIERCSAFPLMLKNEREQKMLNLIDVKFWKFHFYSLNSPVETARKTDAEYYKIQPALKRNADKSREKIGKRLRFEIDRVS